MITRELRNPLGEIGRRVAANIRTARLTRGMTRQEVSADLATIGHPIQVASIGRIENGERRVDVDDLAALGLVLRVRPERLLARTLTPESITYLETHRRDDSGE